MTLQRIIELNKLSQYKPSILTKKDLNFVKIIKKYKYIEVCEFWYDETEYPDLNTWIDIEGIGYGWIWCANKVRSYIKFFQKKAIRKWVLNLLKTIENNEDILYFIDKKNIIHYGFMSGQDCYVQIRLSKKDNLYY